MASAAFSAHPLHLGYVSCHVEQVAMKQIRSHETRQGVLNEYGGSEFEYRPINNGGGVTFDIPFKAVRGITVDSLPFKADSIHPPFRILLFDFPPFRNRI
eukprot:GHVN01092011.1.p1 GENE.GHVN01092011.1~~GHVN01092011.1.p1  ORF type:complete len:100 (-),score=13.52 GHVN01092011.1:117-416(-)